MERRDRTIHGGGIMTFVRSDLQFKRRTDLECQEVETISLNFRWQSANGVLLMHIESLPKKIKF